jgi:hypothetical protein
MNFPPQGTKCVDCVHCDAAIYVNSTPICWHCDACEPCPGKPRSAEAVAPKLEVNAVVNEKETSMPLKGSKLPRISEEVKAVIRRADPTISNPQLAKQFGISQNSVWLIRKQAGIVSPATRGKRKKTSFGAFKGPLNSLVSVGATDPSSERVTVSAACGIKGTITDPSGAVLPNAEVMVGEGESLAFRAPADAFGQYKVCVPTPGTYRVEVRAPGFQVSKTLLEITAGTPRLANFSLLIAPAPPAQITVTICSAVSEERAQAIFARFTPALKAIALQAGLQAAMEEA